jgi:hypothetical protein
MVLVSNNVILSDDVNTNNTNISGSNNKSPLKTHKPAFISPIKLSNSYQFGNQKESKESNNLFFNPRLSKTRSSFLFNFGQFYEIYLSKLKKDINKKKIFQDKLNKIFPYKTKVLVNIIK